MYNLLADLLLDHILISLWLLSYRVTDFDDGRHDDERSEQNIQELMHSHLKGKVRLRLAGDLHHYTRHIAVRKSSGPNERRSRSRSFSHDETMCLFKNEVNKPLKLEPFTEENRPEVGVLIPLCGYIFVPGVKNSYSYLSDYMSPWDKLS